MGFDDVNLENLNFFIFFQVYPFIVAYFDKKKNRITANILKVCDLVKRLSGHLIKSNENYHNYYLKCLIAYSEILE